jgi:hypothetical protein
LEFSGLFFGYFLLADFWGMGIGVRTFYFLVRMAGIGFGTVGREAGN